MDEIIISLEKLNNFKLKNHKYLVEKKHYDNVAGKNEYRLYSYLSTFFNNSIILDIGTYTGRSAVALSHNDTNKVISYDITNHIKNPKHNIYTKHNIEFRIKNVIDDLNTSFVKKCKIIVIDIDHLRVQEEKIIEHLIKNDFSGIIILDDIRHPYKKIKFEMQKLWNNIKYKKYDFTKYGHCSGTGLVIINYNIEFLFEKMNDKKNLKHQGHPQDLKTRIFDLKRINKKINFNIKGILHIGAHLCEELKEYLELGCKKENIIWIEGDKNLIKECKKKDENLRLFNYIVSDKDNEEITFNISNNNKGASSSILDFGTHTITHPSLKFIEKRNCKTTTIKKIFEIENINNDFNFLTLDIQGAELLALKGMGNLLNNFDYIQTEVNEVYVYKKCCLIDELDSYLKKYNFIRLETFWVGKGYGDSIYIKNNNFINFTTLTNDGYTDITMNCYNYYNKCNGFLDLETYCIGDKCYKTLKEKGCKVIKLNENDSETKKFTELTTGKWNKIVYQKFHIIYNNLLKYKYICHTDGDIIFLNKDFIEYCFTNIDDKDVLFQDVYLVGPEKGRLTGIYKDGMACTGFMFIKSNQKTLDFFNPDNIDINTLICDQQRINKHKHKLN